MDLKKAYIVLKLFGLDTEKVKKQVAEKHGEQAVSEIDALVKAVESEDNLLDYCAEVLADSRDKKEIPIRYLVDMCHAGGDLQCFACNVIFNRYCDFAYQIVHKNYSSYSQTYFYDDMLQAAAMGILDAIPAYDCTKGMFTTYSKPFIVHRIQEVRDLYVYGGGSGYYAEQQKKLRSAIEKLTSDGKDVSFEELNKMLPCMSEKILKKELQVYHAGNTVSLDDEKNCSCKDQPKQGVCLIDLYRWSKSPEDLFVDLESREALEKALKDYPDKSLTIYILKNVFRYKIPVIAELLGVSVQDARREYRKIERHMRCDNRLRELYLDSLSC